ncbi:hypothetical protein X975_20062, partial [Stegodyphus mimosarum]
MAVASDPIFASVKTNKSAQLAEVAVSHQEAVEDPIPDLGVGQEEFSNH